MKTTWNLFQVARIFLRASVEEDEGSRAFTVRSIRE